LLMVLTVIAIPLVYLLKADAKPSGNPIAAIDH